MKQALRGVFPVLFAVATIPAITGCTSAISQRELLMKMRESSPPVIVDVRSQGEYDEGHLPGAVHIPFYAIGSGLSERRVSAQRPIVLYCEHGPRAGLAGLSLHLQGYDEVYSLQGHMKAWRGEGLPVETGPR